MRHAKPVEPMEQCSKERPIPEEGNITKTKNKNQQPQNFLFLFANSMIGSFEQE